MHFIGLLSDGGVHSRYNQLLPMLQGAAVPHWLPVYVCPNQTQRKLLTVA